MIISRLGMGKKHHNSCSFCKKKYKGKRLTEQLSTCGQKEFEPRSIEYTCSIIAHDQNSKRLGKEAASKIGAISLPSDSVAKQMFLY